MSADQRLQIFIAHAKEDYLKVLEIYNKLREAGYKPWLDKKDLIPGQNWREEIPKVIRESDIFIACLSTKSVSKRGYVQREFKQALKVLEEMPSGAIYLVPIRLEECEVPEIIQSESGLNFQDIQWLDYWEEEGWSMLVKAIEYGRKTEIPSSQEIAESERKKGFPSQREEGHRNTNKEEVKAVEVLSNQSSTEENSRSPQVKGFPSLQVFEYEVVSIGEVQRVGGFLGLGGKVLVNLNRSRFEANAFHETLPGKVELKMVEIPGGTFRMGSLESEKGSSDEERPQHNVTVSPFFMGKYPITQAQWKAIATLDKIERDLKPDPSYFKGDERPVESVTWYECVEFCKRLSRLTGREYRLPSEAQWEYACRAGTTTPFNFGETITTDLANYDGNYVFASEPKGQDRGETTPVGQFPPNAFGLYDLHGNVWEWCADDYHANYEGAPIDGSAWTSNNDSATKILRGGSWNSLPFQCRSAFRSGDVPRVVSNDDGLRVVCCPPRT